MVLKSTVLLLVLCFQSLFQVIQGDDGIEVGTEITFEGYVMDIFCIQRGVLLDRPDVATLEDPSVHSVHCLIDIDDCVDSGYEILGDPEQEGDLYSRAYRFNDESNENFVEYAKTVGICGECYSGGTIGRGLRASIVGVVTDIGDESIPPTIKVSSFISDCEEGRMLKDNGPSLLWINVMKSLSLYH